MLKIRALATHWHAPPYSASPSLSTLSAIGKVKDIRASCNLRDPAREWVFAVGFSLSTKIYCHFLIFLPITLASKISDRISDSAGPRVSKPISISILGGGSFGTALAQVAASNGHTVKLWMRNKTAVEEVNTQHTNSIYTGANQLSEHIEATDDLAYVVSDAEVVLCVVPSHSYSEVMKNAVVNMPEGCYFVSCTKGFMPGGITTLTTYAADLFKAYDRPNTPVGILSGPNLAAEMVAGQITGTIIASQDQSLIDTCISVFSSNSFRIYGSDDVYGVEIAGIVKNIYAIGFGVADYLEVGNNTKGMMMTRALAEMNHLAETFGANPMTFLGLAGVGDLFTTCTSSLSRNFKLGRIMAQGSSLQKAQADLDAEVEGVETLRAVYGYAESHGLALPIVSALYQFVFQKAPLSDVLSRLLAEQHGDTHLRSIYNGEQ